MVNLFREAPLCEDHLSEDEWVVGIKTAERQSLEGKLEDLPKSTGELRNYVIAQTMLLFMQIALNFKVAESQASAHGRQRVNMCTKLRCLSRLQTVQMQTRLS